MVKLEPFSNEYRPTEKELADLARFHKRAVSDMCMICGAKIRVQVFRNSGVCSERHRKDRDADHLPWGGGALNP